MLERIYVRVNFHVHHVHKTWPQAVWCPADSSVPPADEHEELEVQMLLVVPPGSQGDEGTRVSPHK